MESILEQEASKQHLSFVQNHEDYGYVPESWQHINSLNIKRITFLKQNFYMRYLALPAIYVITLGIFPLFLYWYTHLYVFCIFDNVARTDFEKLVDQVVKQQQLIEDELEKQRSDHELLEGHGYFEEQDCLVTIKVSSDKLNLEKERKLFVGSVTHILVEDDAGEPQVAEVEVIYDEDNRDKLDVYFKYRFIKFRLNFETRRFEPVVFDCIQAPEFLKSKYGKGIQTESEVKQKQELFGKCLIEVPQRPTYTILIDESLTPFHLFQYFNIWLLIKEDFYSYAAVIALITFTSVFIEIYENTSSYQELKDVASYKCLIVVIRENKEQIISSDELVPGDLVIIP